MTGAITQLTLFGQEDVLLSSNPQVTYFRTAFRRATPFSMDAVEQTFQGAADFGKRASMVVSRTGDLVTEIWLQIKLPPLSNFAEPVAAQPAQPLIKYARYASPTSATVAVVPSMALATNAAKTYTATLTPVAGSVNTTAVTATSTSLAPLLIAVPGLDPKTEYTAVVRVSDNTEPASPSTDVLCLKWSNAIGHAIIESVELEIGGSRIDFHTSDFLDILSELTLSEERKPGFQEMIGKYDAYDPRSDVQSFDGERILFVPMQFFFCKNPGLALPILALTFHETRLNFTFRDLKQCLTSTRRPVTALQDDAGNPLSAEIKAYATYVYLDTAERRRYSTIPHESLISTLQYMGDAAVTINPGDAPIRKFPIQFSHPIKELFWVYQPASNYNGDSTTLDWFGYGADDFASEMKIVFNGIDRTSSRPPEYWRLVQPFSHHTRVPNKRIYVFSFSLFPENIQPSGTANFSRIDTAQLVATLKPGTPQGRLRIYGLGYNVLRIASGLGGLAFAS